MGSYPALPLTTQTKYIFAGILFGMVFPAVSTVITIMSEGLSFSPGSLLKLHAATPLLLIIDTAPLILGLTGWWLGNRQKKLEELNERLEADYEQFFALSPDLLCLIGADAKLKKVNPAFSALLDLPKSEIVGRSSWEFVHPEDQQYSKKQVLLVFKNKQPLETESRIKDSDGNWRQIAWNIAPAGPGKVFAMGRDITERSAAQARLAAYAKELEASNKELDQFAYVTSHDLKAPLRAISSLSTFVEEDMLAGEHQEAKKNLELLKKRVERMEGLIAGILEFARVGNKHIDRQMVNVRTVIEETLESLHLPDSMKVELKGEFPVMRLNPIRIRQVFANLIENAYKYHVAKEGTIEISVQEEGECWHFCVRDDGPGIHPDYHDRIFEVFQTLQARDVRESTGIGLSLVRKILEAKGGEIWVESDEGKGAAFHFRIPKVIKEG